MASWSTRSDPTKDPWWDLEGPTARRERRRRRLRRAAAALAWIDVGALTALTVVGPAVYRLAFLR